MRGFSSFHFKMNSSRGGGLLGSVASELLRGVGLGGSLGLADGTGTGNSGGTEVGAVATLGGLVGNGLVGPGVVDSCQQLCDILFPASSVN